MSSSPPDARAVAQSHFQSDGGREPCHAQRGRSQAPCAVLTHFAKGLLSCVQVCTYTCMYIVVRVLSDIMLLTELLWFLQVAVQALHEGRD